MFEITDALRDIGSTIALLGLPIGAVIGFAVLAWFVPAFARLAIAGAVIAAIVAVSLGYGDHHGAARKQVEWNAANARAAAAAAARDASIETKLETDFPPPPAASDQVSPDEAKILADLSAAAAGSCQLGTDALRLRSVK